MGKKDQEKEQGQAPGQAESVFNLQNFTAVLLFFSILILATLVISDGFQKPTAVVYENTREARERAEFESTFVLEGVIQKIVALSKEDARQKAIKFKKEGKNVVFVASYRIPECDVYIIP